MPSEKILAQKQKDLDALIAKIKDSKSGVLVNYMGITAEQDTELRSAFRKVGADYHVYKNTLATRAFDAVGFDALKSSLTGMTALAVAPDEISAAKIAKEYADKVEKFEIKSGYVDEEILDAAGVLELANIPSKEGLIAKLLGSIQSPLYGLACVLQAYIDKQQNGADAEAAPAE